MCLLILLVRLHTMETNFEFGKLGYEVDMCGYGDLGFELFFNDEEELMPVIGLHNRPVLVPSLCVV